MARSPERGTTVINMTVGLAIACAAILLLGWGDFEPHERAGYAAGAAGLGIWSLALAGLL
jgi:hypothetical protein